MLTLLLPYIINLNFLFGGCKIWEGGNYTMVNQEIRICSYNNHTIIHELGHHFETQLSKSDKNRWLGLANLHSTYGYVSEYAKTNEKEDFAETFEYVMNQRYWEIRGLAILKVRLMKQLIDKYSAINYNIYNTK